MSKFSVHNRDVEIPLQGMEFVRFSTCGGLWGLRKVNLSMPPLNNYDLAPFPVRESIVYCLILNSYLSVKTINERE